VFRRCDDRRDLRGGSHTPGSDYHATCCKFRVPPLWGKGRPYAGRYSSRPAIVILSDARSCPALISTVHEQLFTPHLAPCQGLGDGAPDGRRAGNPLPRPTSYRLAERGSKSDCSGGLRGLANVHRPVARRRVVDNLELALDLHINVTIGVIDNGSGGQQVPASCAGCTRDSTYLGNRPRDGFAPGMSPR